MSPRSKKSKAGKPAGASRALPRAPLPTQTGGVHEDKTKRPWRRRKHKKGAEE
jgi:hypothetical protein